MRRLLVLLTMLLSWPGAAAEPKPFDADSLTRILAARPGRPLVVAFWAGNCAPCRAELGLWSGWKRRHPGIDVLLVDVDPPEQQAEAARALAGVPLAGLETWAFADAYVERLRWSVDPAWRGEVPRTHLYDARHRLTVRAGGIAARELDRWAAAAN